MNHQATDNRPDGLGKQPCSVPKCSKRSITGMVRGKGRCPYHWALLMWGKQWADQCYPERKQNEPH